VNGNGPLPSACPALPSGPVLLLVAPVLLTPVLVWVLATGREAWAIAGIIVGLGAFLLLLQLGWDPVQLRPDSPEPLAHVVRQ